MKNIITAIGFLAFMASCSSSGEQPIDSNMDASVTQDDSVYKEESSNSSKEISSADKSVETGLALIEGTIAALVTKMTRN